MKIRPFSDLHLEFKSYDIPELDTDKDSVLVLAGDIIVASHSNYMFYRFKKLIDKCSKQFKHIVMVMGNHEHYDGKFQETADLIMNITADVTNFTLLDNENVVIDDVCFIGSTLWTDCGGKAEAHPTATMHWNSMSDSVVIKYYVPKLNEYKNFPVDKMREEHLKSVEYILKAIAEAKNLGYKAVLVTHHLPTLQSIPKEFVGHALNKFYASDLALDLVDAGVDLCIHGHSHDAVNYPLANAISNARVVSNPRGYAGYEKNPVDRGFNDKLVLEI